MNIVCITHTYIGQTLTWTGIFLFTLMYMCFCLIIWSGWQFGCGLQITLANLKDQPAQATLQPSSSYSASNGVRFVTSKFLGSGNGGRVLSFVGGNGTSKTNGGASRNGSTGGLNGFNSVVNSNCDGKGTYLIFNVGDTLYISELNSQDKVTYLFHVVLAYFTDLG